MGREQQSETNRIAGTKINKGECLFEVNEE